MTSTREKDNIPMGGGKDYPPTYDNVAQLVVEWNGPDDPINPQNWPSIRKLYISLIVCSGAFVACFNSAIFAAGVTGASNELHFSEEVGQLGTTLFVLGFAAGPPLWAPSSELYGRRWPLFIGMLGTSIFTIACAVAKDAQTLLICRFFAGVFGASPLCVVPGVLSDMYSSTYRGMAISIYALTVFGGPLLAPIIGSFIAASYLGWRWTQYLPAILGFGNALLMLLFLREPYAPLVLAEKASTVRRQTGNTFIHAPHEKREVDLRDLMNKYFARPLRMLVTEPTVLLVSLYMSFIYGIVYALLEAYPFVYSSVYGWESGVAHLPFIGLLLGVCCALALILSQQKSYARKLEAHGGVAVPEWRLYPAMLGAFVFPIGLFW
ncbi:hypothetical protein LTR86_002771 [Recurvomyces mirabilis]|nr:hypothetical protein LTR86_002771 [Recurvomyces mirabilis]